MDKNANRPHLKKIMENLANSFGIPGIKEWIHNIEDPLDYEDLNERQAVIRRNLTLLQQKMGILQRSRNLSQESCSQYVNNSGNFNHDDWDKLERLKQDINDYEHSIKEEVASNDAAIPPEVKEQIKAQEKKKEKNKRKIGSYRGWIPS